MAGKKLRIHRKLNIETTQSHTLLKNQTGMNSQMLCISLQFELHQYQYYTNINTHYLALNLRKQFFYFSYCMEAYIVQLAKGRIIG